MDDVVMSNPYMLIWFIVWVLSWMLFIGALIWILRDRKPTGKNWPKILQKHSCDLNAGLDLRYIGQYCNCAIDECKKLEKKINDRYEKTDTGIS